jgi:UDP-2,3-diacylglucosamine hydrolase
MKNKVKKRDFFLFGHQHYPCDIKIDKDTRYINLGDWINHYSYAEFDGFVLKLKYWDI